MTFDNNYCKIFDQINPSLIKGICNQCDQIVTAHLIQELQRSVAHGSLISAPMPVLSAPSLHGSQRSAPPAQAAPAAPAPAQAPLSIQAVQAVQGKQVPLPDGISQLEKIKLDLVDLEKQKQQQQQQQQQQQSSSPPTSSYFFGVFIIMLLAIEVFFWFAAVKANNYNIENNEGKKMYPGIQNIGIGLYTLNAVFIPLFVILLYYYKEVYYRNSFDKSYLILLLFCILMCYVVKIVLLTLDSRIIKIFD